MKKILSWAVLKTYYAFKTVKMGMLTLFFKLIFRQLGHSTRVNGSIIFYCPQNISVGEHCTINEGVMLNANQGSITIGNYVRISPYVMINTAGLDLSTSYKSRKHTGKPVIIEDGVWICTNAIIQPGVKLGEGSVIGEGAVVTKNVEPRTFVAGVPAKKVKDLPQTSPRNNAIAKI